VIERKLIEILRLKDIEVRSRWSIFDIEQTASELSYAESRLNINYKYFLALIEHESGFRPWVINNKNRNGTLDIGLTQQNSCCWGNRYASEFGSKGSKFELLKPWVSVRLMARTFEECKRFDYSIDMLLICYNLPAAVYRDKPNQYLTAVKSKLDKL